MPDWDGDDEEEAEAETELKPLDTAKLTDTAMAQMIELLQEQKLHRQSQVAQAQEQALRASFKDDLFQALLGPAPVAKVLELLKDASPSAVLEVRDGNGMTVLHHAVRLGQWEIVDRCLELCPPLADQVSSPTGRPAHWTALMVAVDMGRGLADEGTLHYILTRLLQEACLATLEVKSANGATVLHMSCSKGMMRVTKRLLYGIYKKAGSNQAAFGLVSSLLRQPNGRGYGCAPWR